MRFILITFLILGFNSQLFDCNAQCTTFENWSQKKDGLHTLCFYPTTLRMVNVNKDKAFNEMVKDIKKLKIILVDVHKAGFKKSDVNVLTQGIRSESYKDMLQFKRGNESFYIFVKEKNEKPVAFTGLVYSDDQLILIDLKGYITPSSIQQIIDGKMNFGAVSKIIDLTSKKEERHGPKEQPKKQ